MNQLQDWTLLQLYLWLSFCRGRWRHPPSRLLKCYEMLQYHLHNLSGQRLNLALWTRYDLLKNSVVSIVVSSGFRYVWAHFLGSSIRVNNSKEQFYRDKEIKRIETRSNCFIYSFKIIGTCFQWIIIALYVFRVLDMPLPLPVKMLERVWGDYRDHVITLLFVSLLGLVDVVRQLSCLFTSHVIPSSKHLTLSLSCLLVSWCTRAPRMKHWNILKI